MRPLVLILSFLLYFNTVNAQIITTIIGCCDSIGYDGDHGPAISAKLYWPTGITIDKTGNIFIADNGNNVIRKVDTTGIISTIAGNGLAGYSGDGGFAIGCQLSSPTGIAIDDSGNIYIADYGNNVIRKINSFGIITTIAGNGVSGLGDGGSAMLATFNGPYGITLDKNNCIYITDLFDYRVRKINTSGIISTIAGNGIQGYTGDGGPAINAEISTPNFLCVDTANNIFVPDWKNHVVRKIDKSGIITTIAGKGAAGNSGDGSLATDAELFVPNGVAIDKTGNIYICDDFNQNIRKINTSGIISTIAGSPPFGFSGDGGLAINAKFHNPNHIIMDNDGNLLIDDGYNNRIRKITLNTGVNNAEKQETDITIHPNPASTLIDISTFTKIENIVITNAIGQTVFTQNNINSEKLKIDLSAFAAGLYFIKINGLYGGKFIKE
jgi:hypothetical protein